MVHLSNKQDWSGGNLHKKGQAPPAQEGLWSLEHLCPRQTGEEVQICRGQTGEEEGQICPGLLPGLSGGGGRQQGASKAVIPVVPECDALQDMMRAVGSCLCESLVQQPV